jgi:hypothetical protein
MEKQTARTRKLGIELFLLITVIPKLHGGYHIFIFVVQQCKALKMCEQIRIRVMSVEWNVLTGNQIKMSYLT